MNKNDLLPSYEKLLTDYLKMGLKVTQAVEKALLEYNIARNEKDGISIATAWRKYKKMKNDSETIK